MHEMAKNRMTRMMRLHAAIMGFAALATQMAFGLDITVTSDGYVVPDEGVTATTITFSGAGDITGTGTLKVDNNNNTSLTINKGITTPINIRVPFYTAGNWRSTVPTGATLNMMTNVTIGSCMIASLSGTINFYGTSLFSQDWYNGGSGGSMHFYAQAHHYGLQRYWLAGPDYYLHIPDAWRARNGATAADYDPPIVFRRDGLIVDCLGNDQHFSGITELNNTIKGIMRSVNPATIYLSGCKNLKSRTMGVTTFGGSFEGALSVVFSGSGLTNTLTGASTSTGTLVASNGTTVVLNGGTWAGSACACEGGAFSFLGDTALTKSTILEIRDAAAAKSQVYVPAGTVAQVHSLKINGLVIDTIGSYGSSASGATYVDDDHFTGEGSVYVTRGTDVGGSYTWSGGGGEDRAIATAANWGGAEADYQSGMSSATFATGGDAVSLTESASFKGLTFTTTSTLPTFSFLQGGGGSLNVLGYGITFSHEDDSVARQLRIDVPYAAATQTLSIPNAADELVFTKGFSGVNDLANITKSGSGILRIGGGLTAPALTIAAGTYYPAAAEDLGSQATTLTVNSGASVVLTGAVETAATFALTGAGNTTLNSGATVKLAPGTTNVFTGTVKVNATGFRVPEDSAIIFAGNYSQSGWFWFNDGGTYIFRKALQNQKEAGFYFQKRNRLVLEQPNNELGVEVFIYYQFNDTSLANRGMATNIVCKVPWALNYPKTSIILGRNTGGWSGVIDLGGGDQGVNWLRTHNNYKPSRASEGITEAVRVTSGTPAILYDRAMMRDSGTGNFTKSTSATNYVAFYGAAGYCHIGTATTTMSWHSPSTGSLGVTNGTLIVAADASWSNACEVVVKDAGHFELTAADQIGKQAIWKLSGADAQVKIPAGVVQKCEELYIDGRRVYDIVGKPGSGATLTDARFTGDGYLRPKGVGTIIFVR